jgi:hypothetical protein
LPVVKSGFIPFTVNRHFRRYPAELSGLRKALLKYCKQDTLGLVCLLEKMRAMEAADAKG